MRPLVQFEDVSIGYGARPVLSGLDLRVENGEFLGIVGPNGSGKTTILRAMSGLLRPVHGNIRFRGQLDATQVRFGYVPQRQSLDEIFPLSTRDVVCMGLYRDIKIGRRVSAEHEERAQRSMDWAGISELTDVSYRDLSGGQKQRALIARALVSDPDLLILDEPTSGMDLAGETAVMGLIAELHDKRELTVVLVSHQLNTVARWVQTIGLLHDGRLHHGSLEAVLTGERLSAVYGAGAKVVEIDGQRVVLPPGGAN